MINKFKHKDPQIDNPAEVVHALEVLFATKHFSRRRLYYENAMRGVFFGVGSIIGATILIALFIWTLSLFDEIPLIGPLFEKTRITIENGSVVR